jgi:hypothetical protein
MEVKGYREREVYPSLLRLDYNIMLSLQFKKNNDWPPLVTKSVAQISPGPVLSRPGFSVNIIK